MEKIMLNSIIEKNNEMVTADMDGETVMMSVKTGKYYNLGKMGSIIWEMIENPILVEIIVSSLLEKYNVDRQQCEEEVLSFLNETGKEGLIDIK